MLNCQARQENNVILKKNTKQTYLKPKLINKLYVTYYLNTLYKITLIVGQAAGWIHSTIHFV